MRKYIEDQGKDVQQLSTPQTQAVDIEVPKVIASLTARPKIMQKTGIVKKVKPLVYYIFFILEEEALTCVLCLTTERQVACLPCGHLTSCVACGHSLKTCPICRATVKAFVRIYV
jgi:hypothetical protein